MKLSEKLRKNGEGVEISQKFKGGEGSERTDIETY